MDIICLLLQFYIFIQILPKTKLKTKSNYKGKDI